MASLQVDQGTRITLFFELKLQDGSVVDSNFDHQPASFEFGDGSLLPGFENKLIGLQTGDEASFTIKPEDGFGQPNPNNVQQFKRSDFAADMELAPGLVISFQDAAQGELPGVIKAVSDEQVEVDFNHPLAGRDIEFRVKIEAVEPAQSQEVH